MQTKIEKFEDLLAWQQARALTKAVYSAARNGALAKDYALKDQIQRAAVSAMSNIAEGFERANKQEKLNFLNIARASCGEVRSLLYVCSDAQLLDEATISELRSATIRTGQLISGFMRSLKERSSKIEVRSPSQTPISHLPSPISKLPSPTRSPISKLRSPNSDA